MSGIAGIITFDQRPVSREEVDTLAASIVLRGEGETKIWLSRQAGLAHAMLRTTPESLTEQLPYYDTKNQLAITADARIDNRDELAHIFGLSNHKSRAMADSEFILEAYKKWGTRCAAKLLGDFAFAIWDNRQQQIYCARDHMGIKPFYYHNDSHSFLFSSRITTIKQSIATPFTLNQQRLLDYLAFLSSDPELTFYNGIHRLPARCEMIVTVKGKKIREYFSFSPHNRLKLKSDKEYEEAFRELFFKAVNRTLRSAFPIGSTLSGGLDSSSISCAAAQLLHKSNRPLLNTYSAIFPSLTSEQKRMADEMYFMQKVISQEHVTPHMVVADRYSPFDQLHREQDGAPNPCFNMYIHDAMFRHARDIGARIFLDGTDGDSTVSMGYDHLTDLGRQFRIFPLLKEAQSLAAIQGLSWTNFDIIRRYVCKPLVPEWLKAARRKLYVTNAAEGWICSNLFATPDNKQSLLTARREKIFGKETGRQTAVYKHCQLLSSPIWSDAMEHLDRSAARFCQEGRYPFWDRQLMEFCLALPANQKLRMGETRSILRRAMHGILPDSIRFRASKARLFPHFENSVRKYGAGMVKRQRVTGHLNLPYLDLDMIDRLCQKMESDGDLLSQNDFARLFILAALGQWHKANAQIKFHRK